MIHKTPIIACLGAEVARLTRELPEQPTLGHRYAPEVVYEKSKAGVECKVERTRSEWIKADGSHSHYRVDFRGYVQSDQFALDPENADADRLYLEATSDADGSGDLIDWAGQVFDNLVIAAQSMRIMRGQMSIRQGIERIEELRREAGEI